MLIAIYIKNGKVVEVQRYVRYNETVPQGFKILKPLTGKEQGPEEQNETYTVRYLK
jgi:hypothetical protein